MCAALKLELAIAKITTVKRHWRKANLAMLCLFACLTMNNNHLRRNGTTTERETLLNMKMREEEAERQGKKEITIIRRHVLSCHRACFLQLNPLVPCTENIQAL